MQMLTIITKPRTTVRPTLMAEFLQEQIWTLISTVFGLSKCDVLVLIGLPGFLSSEDTTVFLNCSLYVYLRFRRIPGVRIISNRNLKVIRSDVLALYLIATSVVPVIFWRLERWRLPPFPPSFCTSSSGQCRSDWCLSANRLLCGSYQLTPAQCSLCSSVTHNHTNTTAF